MPPEININDIHQTFTMPWNHQNRYRIRAMHETDVFILVAIEQDIWGSEAWPAKNFFEALKDPLYNCWILESTKTDYVVLGYGLQELNDNISHIVNLCLHPNRRGRGLGGILLRHMIDYARKNNASIVELEVNTLNEQAYKLYVKHGFQITEYLSNYYRSDYSDAYRMRLIF